MFTQKTSNDTCMGQRRPCFGDCSGLPKFFGREGGKYAKKWYI